MPTYEYACDACGHQWEQFQRITEDPVRDCPKCGRPEARRLISQGNFILKGGGWYADLYSGPSNRKGNGAKGDRGGEKKKDSQKGSGASASSGASKDA